MTTPKTIALLMDYANPHVLGWIRELRTLNYKVSIFCLNSVTEYREGYFSELDDCEDIIYLFKNKDNYKFFYRTIKKTDIYISLGIFEPTFLKSLCFVNKRTSVYVLSEPFNPVKSKKHTFIRKLVAKYCLMLINKINFLCIGGKEVMNYYVPMGFKNCNYYNFGYFPKSKGLRKEINFVPNTIRFIFVGQLIERKGISHLIESLKYLDQHFEDDLWSFKIIGNGFLKNELENALQLINNKNISYLGTINDKEVIESHYNSSDVLFIPSQFDGWGAVVSEAISKNLAILSSDMVFASKALVKNNFNGYIFNYKKPCQMKAYLSYLLSNKNELKVLKKNSKLIFAEWNHINAANSFSNLINFKENNNKTLLKRIQ